MVSSAESNCQPCCAGSAALQFPPTACRLKVAAGAAADSIDIIAPASINWSRRELALLLVLAPSASLERNMELLYRDAGAASV